MRSLTTLGLSLCAAVTATALGAADARATTVRFTSNVGTFDVELFDADQPVTVANFLAYVNAGRYDNSIVHRSEPSFVIQGGGFYNAAGLPAIPAFAPVPHEALAHHNVRGTIGMARPSDPDSATSQWFINLGDNAANVDNQAGGFVVFGQVVGDGMETVDAIAALPTVNLNDPVGNFYTVPFAGDHTPTLGNLVTFSSVAVVPEPASGVVVAVGLACVVGRRVRRGD